MHGADETENMIAGLDHTELSAVIFIRDYMQLVFEGGGPHNFTLTAFTLPVVRVDGLTYPPLTAGYRDALCTLIGNKVRKAEAQEGVEIRVVFDSDRWILISLREEAYVGPEAAMLDDGERLSVW